MSANEPTVSGAIKPNMPPIETIDANTIEIFSGVAPGSSIGIVSSTGR